MKNLKIHMNMRQVPVKKALKEMTDDWVDDGNYCAQTVIDLRDALKEALNELKLTAKQIKELHEKETTTTKTVSISTPKSECCCDYTNHCPVHGSRTYKSDDSYINRP